ncbi:hypothetical protein [Caulobacter sp. DWR2-3-1b2]|uniref:hypothetical protein n=1 Tax=unclassified Caulobacter TaxID=2648921 RepID=UPI003CEDE69F
MTVFSEIAARVAANLEGLEDALGEFSASLPLSKEWIQREVPLASSNPANPLLSGTKIALLEAGAAWAIGANRGAASSIRAYIENAFAWLYYKDHPVEFRVVDIGRSELTMPKGVQSYLKQVDGGFEKSYSVLAKCSMRGMENEYFYSNVSQFLHAHPAFSSLAIKIEEYAISSPRDMSFLKICRNVDEFISDNFTAYYRSSWDDVPGIVQKDVSSRLDKKLKEFLSIV